MTRRKGWPNKEESWGTTIKRRAKERAAQAADRRAKADRGRREARAICDAIMADSLTGYTLTPEQRAEVADRVNRRWSLRGTPWSY